jgi:hypothetical protein
MKTYPFVFVAFSFSLLPLARPAEATLIQIEAQATV